MSAPWLEALREERAAQLTTLPRLQTLVQAHVEQAVAERVDLAALGSPWPKRASASLLGSKS